MIKGVDPWENKKETLSDKLKYFCSKHHWNNGELISQITDKDGDGYCKPTLKLFLYNCYRELRGWTPIYKLRMFMQKTFRSDHLSDDRIWEASYYLSKYCLKVLKAFKQFPRHGYPSIFSEWDENSGYSKEKYDELKEAGQIIGGGEEAWEKVIDHIIMALEYRAYEGNYKLIDAWWQKYFGMDPHDENNECNKYVKYEYRYKDDPKSIGCTMSFHNPPKDPERCEYIKKEYCYGNTDLISYAEEIVQDGLCLFGRFFSAFWD
jgi:hypothetical protein